MGKLLIEENPLMLLPSLAVEYGLHEAIVIQQLHYWIIHTGPSGRRYGIVKDGYRWIRNTVEEWQKTNFPFLSDSQIYRSFVSLEKATVIRSRKDLNKAGYDRTKWYTIDYAILHQREMELTPARDAIRASEDTIPETTTETTTEISTGDDKNIYQLYEENIGALTPLVADALQDLESDLSAEWVAGAIAIAAKANARNMSYIEAILKRWENQGAMDDGKKTAGGAQAASSSLIETMQAELAEVSV